METGFGKEELELSEIEAFWQEEPDLELDSGSLVPEMQTDEESHRYRRKPTNDLTFEQGRCQVVEEPLNVQAIPPEVERVWVYRYQPRYSMYKAGERLFILFSTPLHAGFPTPSPEGVEIAQEGRWEYLNPRTLCFRPAAGRITASQVTFRGEAHDIEGVS